MRIYRLSIRDSQEGRCYSWHPSKRDAEHALAEQRRGEDGENIDSAFVAPVDFPTRKVDLIEWLNIHYTRDNG